MRDDDSALFRALTIIRDRGAIGTTELGDAVAHADRFVAALPDGAHRLADIGSGGGLPGLVIGVRRPDVEVTLIERRGSRADLLRRAVAALRVSAHVEVVDDDVEQVARREGRTFDVVTARSFGSPHVTLQAASGLLVPGGLLLVSEPPHERAAAWNSALGAHRDFRDSGCEQGVRRVTRVSLH